MTEKKHSIQYRVMHVDLKGLIPQAEYMSKLFRDLAGFGYTDVLLEFEDKFPFESCPETVHKAAYSKAEFAELAQQGVNIIPLLQCAGHLDYLLAHDKYAFLRDKGNNTYQWNMRDDRIFELWKNMLDEILKVYPDCKFFHIGADEVELESDEDFIVYIKHVERCADHLRSLGKQVLVWDDVFRNRQSAELDRLLQKVIVCVWQYEKIDESLVSNMLERGAKVWGTSRVYANCHFRGMGKFAWKFKNIEEWSNICRQHMLEGHIGTLWGRYQCHTPMHAALPEGMYLAAYQAARLLNNEIDRLEFDRKFAGEYFNTPELELTRLVNFFGVDPEDADTLLIPVRKNSDIAEIWKTLNEFDKFAFYTLRCFADNQALLPAYRQRVAPPKMTNNYLDGVRITAEWAEKLQKEIRQCFSKYFCI